MLEEFTENNKEFTEKNENNENIEEIKTKLEETQKLAEERLCSLKYMQADFENYVKKFEKEKEEIIKLANENLIRELMIILDDFENSLKQIKDEKVKEGIEILQKKFLNILEKHELKQIQAIGKLFDPNFHEVLYKEPSDQDEDVVIEEIQKGYILYSKVIRPSKVKVAQCNKTKEE